MRVLVIKKIYKRLGGKQKDEEDDLDNMIRYHFNMTIQA